MKFFIFYFVCSIINLFVLPILDIVAKSQNESESEIKITLTDILIWILFVILGPVGSGAFLIILVFAFIDYVKYHGSKIVWRFNKPKWLKK